ncbi:MAG TPA: helix-hairpin-helix domain-containing protein, partial [Dehalococcoidia bacterium]|nr:helix-hairpin-helix domain-containing protein [Dehalococcoidia bacterium]
MSVSNEEIAQLFENMASLLEMKGDAVFKIRAYQRAARTIEQLPFELEQAVAEGMDLKKVPGIGKAINDKIYELVQTSKVSAYEKLLSELPQGAPEIMTIPSVGPKTARLIAKELGVSTIEELEQAIRAGKVAGLPGLGGKTADNILHHIESMRIKDQRTPIGEALSIAERVVSVLREKCPHIGQLYPAGSLRRWEETIGDIDLVGTSPHPEEVSQALVSLPEVQEVLGHGTKKTSVVVKPGMQIDLRMGDDESFGALLQYFTGNRQHNIRLRDYANRMGLSLNEYGITDIASGKMEVFPDEASFYARLDLPYIPPEIRTGMGELEVALEGKLPRLVEESDLKGDLHLHSNWSDGRDSIEVMLEAVAAQGYEYMALTDHSSGRGIANGLSNERLLKQTELLRSFQEKYSMTILCGSEVDIRADGTMDYPDELLEQLDVVVASVHSAMGQDRETMTRR